MDIVEPPGGVLYVVFVVFLIATIVPSGFTKIFEGLGGVPNSDQMILGAASIVFVQIIVVGLAGSFMGKNGPDAVTVDSTETAQSPA